jgi:hypothetical protein
MHEALAHERGEFFRKEVVFVPVRKALCEGLER